jgi:hypothetical protein
MHANAEFWIPFSISLVLGCDDFQRVGLLLFEIFQNPFEKFCPSVLWDLPVRHFRVIFAFLDFRAELGFQGRFLIVEPGSRLSGYPAGGRSILFTSHQMLPYNTGFDSIFDLRAGFRVLGRSPVVRPKSSITGPPKTFL